MVRTAGVAVYDPTKGWPPKEVRIRNTDRKSNTYIWINILCTKISSTIVQWPPVAEGGKKSQFCRTRMARKNGEEETQNSAIRSNNISYIYVTIRRFLWREVIEI